MNANYRDKQGMSLLHLVQFHHPVKLRCVLEEYDIEIVHK